MDGKNQKVETVPFAVEVHGKVLAVDFGHCCSSMRNRGDLCSWDYRCWRTDCSYKLGKHKSASEGCYKIASNARRIHTCHKKNLLHQIVQT